MSLINLVIGDIIFIISHVGFESAEFPTSVRLLFIGVEALLRNNEIASENKGQ